MVMTAPQKRPKMICINLAVKACQLSLLKRTKLFHVASRVNCRRRALRGQKFRVNPDVKHAQRNVAAHALRRTRLMFPGEKWRAWSYFSPLGLFRQEVVEARSHLGPGLHHRRHQALGKKPVRGRHVVDAADGRDDRVIRQGGVFGPPDALMQSRAQAPCPCRRSRGRGPTRILARHRKFWPPSIISTMRLAPMMRPTRTVAPPR
jgi:hypothetical protein